MRLLPLTIVTALLLGACTGPAATNIEVKTTPNAAQLVRHKSYAYAKAPTNLVGHTTGSATPDVLTVAKREIDAELQAKGYTLKDEAEAELVVVVAAGTRNVVDQPSAGATRTGGSAKNVTERAIVVEILERPSNEQVFHGYAHYAGADPAQPDPAVVRQAVSKIFADVPRAAQ